MHRLQEFSVEFKFEETTQPYLPLVNYLSVFYAVKQKFKNKQTRNAECLKHKPVYVFYSTYML